MLNSYNTESADTLDKNVKRSLQKSPLTKMSMLQGTSLTVLRHICSERISGNKDLRKENVFCMPEELIPCCENKIRMTF